MANVAADVTSALADVDVLDAHLAALLPSGPDVSHSQAGDVSISRHVATYRHQHVCEIANVRNPKIESPWPCREHWPLR